MTTVWTILAAIIIFALMIFVHEFGHFAAAKLSKIKVHEFAIGMGPKLFSFGRGETKYSVRAFPIGGYCMLEGENEASSDERAFINKPAYIRLIVLVAGAFMNILLGFVLLNIVNGFSPSVTTTKIEIVEENSPAYTAGLMVGDEIIKVNSKRVSTFNELAWELGDAQKESADLFIKRDGEQKTITVFPEITEKGYRYGIRFASEKNNVFNTIKQSFRDTLFYSKVIISSLFDLIRGRLGLDQMSGPIGIVSEIGSAVNVAVESGRQGFLRLILLAVLLTVNLGVFNLLPLPALDGGRILFVLIEMIRRKPLPPEKEGMVHAVGFAALMVLSVFIAFKDVLKFF